jgi:hypothetical protein
MAPGKQFGEAMSRRYLVRASGHNSPRVDGPGSSDAFQQVEHSALLQFDLGL